MLDDFEVKLLSITSKILLIISLLLLILSIWLISFCKAYKEPIIYFPVILSISFLSYIYRVNKLLKVQDRNIEKFQLKCLLLTLSKDIFISVAYLGMAVSNVFYTICFMSLATLALICEFIIKK